MQTFYCTAADDETGTYTWEKPKGGGVAPQLEVSVTPPALEPEQSKKVELRFRLPEGMTLLNPATEEVTVFRKKK